MVPTPDLFRQPTLLTPQLYTESLPCASLSPSPTQPFRELQRRFQEQSLPLAALVCHPGVIPTSDLFRHNTIPWPIHQGLMLALKPFFKSIPQGAATQTYLATSDAVLQLGGDYFADCNINPSSPASHDKALAARLWAMSDRMCGFA